MPKMLAPALLPAMCTEPSTLIEKMEKKAIQRLVPARYKMQVKDASLDLDKGDISVPLHQDTVLLKEAGLHCFLLRCNQVTLRLA